MSNYLDFISLRRNCTSRFIKSDGPTPSIDAFLLKDFTSPSFIDQISSSYQTIVSQFNTDTLLNAIVHQLECSFDSLEREIASIKATLVSRARSLFNNNRHTMEINNLTAELRTSHQRVLEQELDPKAIEEFVMLFNHLKEKTAVPPQPVSSSLIFSFQELCGGIQREMTKAIQLCSEKSIEELVSIPDAILEKTASNTKSYKLKELFQTNSRNVQGCWLELEGRSSLLCIGNDKKVGAEPLQAKLYAIGKGKLCYSIPNCDRLPHAYSKKLNCLAFCYARSNGPQKELIVDLHRITACGAKKVSGILAKDRPTAEDHFWRESSTQSLPLN